MKLTILHLLMPCFSSIAAALSESAVTPSSSSLQAFVPFFIPTVNGGSWFDDAGDGFGEPLNVGCDCSL